MLDINYSSFQQTLISWRKECGRYLGRAKCSNNWNYRVFLQIISKGKQDQYCCWSCVACLPHEILVNESTCVQCFEGFWPNKNQTRKLSFTHSTMQIQSRAPIYDLLATNMQTLFVTKLSTWCLQVVKKHLSRSFCSFSRVLVLL